MMKSYRAHTLVFVLAASLFALCSAHLRQFGYSNEVALHRWAEIVKLADTPHEPSQSLTRSFPFLPSLLLLAGRVVAGSLPLWAPYWLSNLAGAALITALYHRLCGQSCSNLLQAVFLAVACVHPFFLWTVTSGDLRACLLLLYACFCWTVSRAIEAQDARSLMTVAGMMPLLLFCDGRAVYLLLAMLPLLPFVLPRSVVWNGAAGGYILLLTPLSIALVSCLYAGLTVMNESGALLRTAFSWTTSRLQDSPWQLLSSDSLVWCSTQIVFAAALSVPATRRLTKDSLHRKAMLFGAALPVIAAWLAQADGKLPHPAAFLYLLFAPWMLLITEQFKQTTVSAVALLLLGVAGAWNVFLYLPSSDMSNWTACLRGQQMTSPYVSETALGQWLLNRPGEVLADDQTFDAVLATRGHAQRMVFPNSAKFQLQTQAQMPEADYVIVQNPNHADQFSNALAQRYPNLYQAGLPGYELNYDQLGWRVYSRSRTTAKTIKQARAPLTSDPNEVALR